MSAKRTAVPLQVIQGGAGGGGALDELTGTGHVRLVSLPLADLRQHPDNPRRDLGDLGELAASIGAQGVQQPLMVVPDPDDADAYRIVIGHRRAAAAGVAGLATVPAIVRSLSPLEQRELMLVENLQRADLSPVEEADAYQGLLDLGVDVAGIVASTGRSESTVRRRLALAALPEKARVKVHEGQATLAQADRLGEFEDDPEVMARLAKALGSPDFDNEVLKATKKRTITATVQHLVGLLEAAGASRQATWEGWIGNAVPGMRSVDYLSRWELEGGLENIGVKTFVGKIPADASGWVFRAERTTHYDHLYLFRPADEPVGGSAEATVPGVSADPEVEQRQQRWEREAEQRRALWATLQERHERFTALRSAFVDGLRARRLTATQTTALLGFAVRRGVRGLWTGEDHYAPDRLRAWLGLEPFGSETSAEQDEAVVFAAIDELDTAHQLLALVVIAEESGLGPSVYDDPRALGYYGLLEELGYQVSTDEREALTPPPAQPATDVDVDDAVEGGED